MSASIFFYTFQYVCLQDMDETSDEEEGGSRAPVGLAGAGSALGASAMGLPQPDVPDETRDMSVSTLHLYDIHLSQVSNCWF